MQGFGFAELTVSDAVLDLHLRGPLMKWTRAESLRVSPTDLESVFPIRSRVRFCGVGFRRFDGREYYFKTFATDEILEALHEAGFPVSDESHPAAKIWQGRP